MLNLNLTLSSICRIASRRVQYRIGPFFSSFLKPYSTRVLCSYSAISRGYYLSSNSISPTSIILAFSTRFQGTLLILAHPPTFNLLIVDSEGEGIQTRTFLNLKHAFAICMASIFPQRHNTCPRQEVSENRGWDFVWASDMH